MFNDIGLANSAGVAAALLVGVSLIPVALTHWKGDKLKGTMSIRM